MKRISIFLIIIFCLTGCKKEIDIYTSINKNDYFSSIEYPIFNIKKLDNKIKKEIETIQKDFEKNSNKNHELNIDFETTTFNNCYISVRLTVTTHKTNKTKKIYTYLFDKKNNKFITLDSLIDNTSQLKKLVKKEFKNKYGKNLNFKYDLNYSYIGKNYVNFYLSGDKDYLIQISLDEIPFNFKINNEEDYQITDIIEIKNNNIDLNKPVVALTFDDGPSKYTNEILNILKENNVTATFFVLGNKVNYYQETLLKMRQNGNEIGNHTYNHKWLTNLNNIEIKQQINDTQQLIFEATGYTPTIFRPSYGDLPKQIQNEINLDVILWNIDTLDWKYKSKNKIINIVTNETKDGDIILMHDIFKRTKDALPTIIKKLKQKGFQFVTVSELNEIKKIRNYNGQ